VKLQTDADRKSNRKQLLKLTGDSYKQTKTQKYTLNKNQISPQQYHEIVQLRTATAPYNNIPQSVCYK